MKELLTCSCSFKRSKFIYIQKTLGPFVGKGTDSWPKETLTYTHSTNMEFCLVSGQARWTLPKHLPHRPRKVCLQVNHSHFLGSLINSVNDLRSFCFSTSFPMLGVQGQHPVRKREQDARNRGQGHLGLVRPLSFLGNGFLSSASKFTPIKWDASASTHQIPVITSLLLFCVSVYVLNSDAVFLALSFLDPKSLAVSSGWLVVILLQQAQAIHVRDQPRLPKSLSR